MQNDKYYINIWKGQYGVCSEGNTIYTSLDNAREDFEIEGQYSEYVETIIASPSEGTCEKFDFQLEKEEKEESDYREEVEWDKENLSDSEFRSKYYEYEKDYGD